MAIQDRLDRDESPQAARQTVFREFGNVMLVKDLTREQWGGLRLDRLQKDVHYALRQLRRYPGIAAIAILMLALGIGANTAVFSVFNQVLLRSLPVQSPIVGHFKREIGGRRRIIEVTGQQFGSTLHTRLISRCVTETIHWRASRGRQ